MKQITIIGTLHGGWTSNDELEEILYTSNPDKVLIELSAEELHERPREDSIRDEMFVAYDWAVANNIRVDVFDVENNTLKEGVTGKESDFMKLQNQMKDILKDFSWKDLNQPEPWNIPEVLRLENLIIEKYFDREKSKQRDFNMLKNIKDKLIEGRNTVITGAGHLTFLKEQLPDADLPLRS